MNRKRILVTGGTGFIGRSLVRALVKKGHHVRVLDDNSRGNSERLADLQGQIEFIAGDVRDRDTVFKAAKGMQTVAHLAFVNGTEFFYKKPELVLEVGVKGMMHVLDACVETKIRELLLMSSSEVYQTPPRIPTDESAPFLIPDPHNPRFSYAGGKIISELLAINYGRTLIPKVVIVRPHNVFGPDMGWEHVIPQLALRMKDLVEKHGRGKTFPFPIQGSGEETRAFVYIDDFTEGTMLALENGKHLGIYHVGTMEERKIRDVVLEVARCFETRVEIIPSSPAEGGTLRRCPDTRKIQGLGYVPKIRFEDGLQKTVDWYRKNKKP